MIALETTSTKQLSSKLHLSFPSIIIGLPTLGLMAAQRLSIPPKKQNSVRVRVDAGRWLTVAEDFAVAIFMEDGEHLHEVHSLDEAVTVPIA